MSVKKIKFIFKINIMIKKIFNKLGEKQRENLEKCRRIVHTMNMILIKDFRGDDGKTIQKNNKKENEVYQIGQLKFQYGKPLPEDSYYEKNMDNWSLIQFENTFIGGTEWGRVRQFPEHYNLKKIHEELVLMLEGLQQIKQSKRYK